MPIQPAVIERLYAAWNDRDLDALRACLVSDCELHVPGAIPFADEIHGTDAVCEYARQVWAFWPEGRAQVERVACDGPHVVVRGRHTTDGEDPRRGLAFVHAILLDGDRVVALREQLDAGKVVRAVSRRLREGADVPVGSR